MGALDDEVHSMFAHLEDNLLDAFLGGQPSLESFVDRLSSLYAITSSAISSRKLNTKSLGFIRNVALSGSLLADNILQLRSDTRKVDEERQSDISDVFRRMSLNDTESHSTGVQSTKSLSSTPKKLSLQSFTCPSVRRQASASTSDAVAPSQACTLHRWFLENIHSPYPNKCVRMLLVKEANLSEKEVNSWMAQMRRRVGWSHIVKKHFNKDRVLAVDFASHVFLGSKSSHPINQAIAREFLIIKEVTQRLYEENYETSELAKKIKELVSEVPEVQQASSSKRRTTKPKKPSRNLVRQRSVDSHARTANWILNGTSAPSADRECDTMTGDDIIAWADDLLGTKRKTQSDSGKDEGNNAHLKRRRTSSSEATETSTDASTTGPSTPELPSLALPDDVLKVTTTDKEFDGLFGDLGHPSMTKRRLSESDTTSDVPAAKRHRGPTNSIAGTEPAFEESIFPHHTVPSTHLESTELQMLRQLESALQLGIPDHAELGTWITEGNLDVNLFDYSAWVGIPDAHIAIEADSPLRGLNTDSNTFVQSEVEKPTECRDSSQALDEFLRQLNETADLLVPNHSGDGHETTSDPVFGDHPFPSNLSYLRFPSDVSSLDPTFALSGVSLPQSEPNLPVSVPDISSIQPENTDVQLSIFDDRLIMSLLELDREAKLERLKVLRDERSRIVEEEQRLEQDLLSLTSA